MYLRDYTFYVKVMKLFNVINIQQIEMTKRNTSDSHPYFTKNMSNTLYSEYKKKINSSPE